MTGDSIVVALLAGVVGAPHCIIMCGGIGSSIAMEAKSNALRPLLAYHLGRIVTYGLTGAIMGAAGSFLNVVAGHFVGFQALASMLGGAMILLWAFRKYSLPLHGVKLPGRNRLRKFVDRIRSSFELTAIFLTGLMLGLLPCGLTYSMQMRAAASGSWLDGFFMLFLFGLATIPMLVIVALSAKGFNRKWRQRLRKAGFFVAVLMGVLSIMKGLSANDWIPSVHPWLW